MTFFNRDNAVKAYLWLEMIILSTIILLTSSYLHFTLIPLIGMLVAIRLKDDIDQFYRFIYSFTYGLFLLQTYIYIKDQAYYVGMFGLSLTLFFFMILRREQMKGKTL